MPAANGFMQVHFRGEAARLPENFAWLRANCRFLGQMRDNAAFIDASDGFFLILRRRLFVMGHRGVSAWSRSTKCARKETG
ncbi:hypothetical protein [Neoaquamicrobium microcysteis]|uniref:hypothetical protein n=1 Tax=Neoaquamicrobium microcysteis TaxID=2682781 RepID=UPI0013758517|nr:hypothetical protein [Mesorhizobium microcysteis]